MPTPVSIPRKGWRLMIKIFWCFVCHLFSLMLKSITILLFIWFWAPKLFGPGWISIIVFLLIFTTGRGLVKGITSKIYVFWILKYYFLAIHKISSKLHCCLVCSVHIICSVQIFLWPRYYYLVSQSFFAAIQCIVDIFDYKCQLACLTLLFTKLASHCLENLHENWARRECNEVLLCSLFFK